MNPYQVLGVRRSATSDEVRQAFRKMAREWHPDVSKRPDATRKFQEINEAHQLLSDPARRRDYDRENPAQTTAPNREPSTKGQTRPYHGPGQGGPDPGQRRRQPTPAERQEKLRMTKEQQQRFADEARKAGNGLNNFTHRYQTLLEQETKFNEEQQRHRERSRATGDRNQPAHPAGNATEQLWIPLGPDETARLVQRVEQETGKKISTLSQAKIQETAREILRRELGVPVHITMEQLRAPRPDVRDQQRNRQRQQGRQTPAQVYEYTQPSENAPPQGLAAKVGKATRRVRRFFQPTPVDPGGN